MISKSNVNGIRTIFVVLPKGRREHEAEADKIKADEELWKGAHSKELKAAMKRRSDDNNV